MNGTVMRGAKALLCAVMAAGVFTFAAPAYAQEVAPEQLALARKYVDLTDNGAIFETTVVETGVATLQQITSLNPELGEQTTAVIDEVIKEYSGRKGELLDQFARLYAMRFNMEELNQIVAFYESPTGQKLANANNELNQDLSRVLQVYTNNLRSEFFAKVRAGLRAQGVEL
ncbi:DUF2059 domain-containing protein [Devosia rhizoryzae]|uniref:DUF2059 domain-containing protein n=1 Tax=Devosia rhizoryzae TaxID=2774137 RepID=A0ABX7C101_9HYPH|nr:DUF2059 domain-containing protein [Devosia rhizoryzae]